MEQEGYGSARESVLKRVRAVIKRASGGSEEELIGIDWRLEVRYFEGWKRSGRKSMSEIKI